LLTALFSLLSLNSRGRRAATFIAMSSPAGSPSAPLPPSAGATEAAASDGTRLDEAALARLRELDPEGRHGVLRRVLQAFDTSLSRMLVQLTAERGGNDSALVAGIAHTLKSSAASVGAARLAAACADIEKRQRSADGALHVGADIEQLHREGQAALTAVRAMLRT
jgi:HPt (histidine-containing phosphotransfer) domain-containing protein